MTSGPGDDPQVRQFPYAPEANALRPRTVGHTIGVVLVAILALLGLFAFIGVVMFAVALNNMGSNK